MFPATPVPLNTFVRVKRVISSNQLHTLENSELLRASFLRRSRSQAGTCKEHFTLTIGGLHRGQFQVTGSARQPATPLADFIEQVRQRLRPPYEEAPHSICCGYGRVGAGGCIGARGDRSAAISRASSWQRVARPILACRNVG